MSYFKVNILICTHTKYIFTSFYTQLEPVIVHKNNENSIQKPKVLQYNNLIHCGQLGNENMNIIFQKFEMSKGNLSTSIKKNKQTKQKKKKKKKFKINCNVKHKKIVVRCVLQSKIICM
eukprot:304614_1